MSALAKLSAVLILLSGCTVMDTEITTLDENGLTTTRHSHLMSFFSKTAIAGYESGRTTRTTSTIQSVKNSATETEVEKLGPLIEAAVSGAVQGAAKGVKP